MPALEGGVETVESELGRKELCDQLIMSAAGVGSVMYLLYQDETLL